VMPPKPMMPGGTPPKSMMPGGTPPVMASITGFNLYNGPGVFEHAYFP
jgi:hypothetical protein